MLNYLRLIYTQFLISLLTAIFIFLSTWLLISTSGLQPSTAIAIQLLGKSYMYDYLYTAKVNDRLTIHRRLCGNYTLLAH